MDYWQEMDSSGQEDRAEQARAAQKKQQARLKEAVRCLMASIHGRTLLRELINESGVLKAECPPESNQLYFSAGRRSMGIFVLSLINGENPANLSRLLEAENDG